MRIEKDDFLIVTTGDTGKNVLVQCVAYDSKESEYVGVIDDKFRAHKETQSITRFTPGDVVANLGPAPVLGNAYKVKVEPFRSAFNMKPWGTVYLFRDMSESETLVLKRGLQEVGKWIVDQKLDRELPLEIHVKPPRGRYAGFYSSPRGEDAVPVITLQPKAMENMRYVLLHEYAHHIWFRMLPPRMHARWVQLYHKCISLSPVLDAQVATLLSDFKSAHMTLREFRSELGDDKEGALFDEVMGYISSYHNLTQRHLQLLLDESFPIDDFWPRTALELQEMDLTISEYAQKSPEEYWPEAVAFTLSKMPVPEFIKEEVKAGLRVARGERVNLPPVSEVVARGANVRQAA